jgi:hypothetical protein
VIKNFVPIIKCSPSNPIATKKVNPCAEPLTVNGTSVCFYACMAVR